MFCLWRPPTYAENVYTTWQEQDNQDQRSQHCQLPKQGNEELKDKYSPSKNEFTTDYYE